MIIRAVKDLTNARLAGEQLTYSTLKPYLDAVVDEINSKLHAKFRTFSEVSPVDTGVDYNEFPDKYIRTVVAVGAAAKWYVDDEEGIETATSLMQQYNNNLFIMMRDYGPLVPAEKQADSTTGYIPGITEFTQKINPDLRYIEVEGVPGTSISNFQIVSKEDGKHLFATLVDYKYGSKIIDCGVVNTEIVTIKMDAKGDLIALLSNGTVHVIGNMISFMQNYFTVAIDNELAPSKGANTIGFEIGDL